MRTHLLRLTCSTEFGPRRSLAVLLLILLAVALCSVFLAVEKPFWFDEICTVIMCRLPGASELCKALNNAADGNPPGFYLVARFTRQFVSDDHLGYRLPSILGFLGALSCIYVILSKRVNHLSALVGATFVLCTQFAAYAYEARPYGLVLGCLSVAILAWQRIDDSKLYSFVLAIGLAASVSLHYYAILVWPAFVLAEASMWIVRRRFRVGAWAGLLAGSLPVLLFAPLLLKLRQYCGQHFWAKPSIKQAITAHNWLFGSLENSFGGIWGWPIAAGITVIFLYYNVAKSAGNGSPDDPPTKVKVLPIEEQTLILTLLWLPLFAVPAALIGHGGMTGRYMLPTILGGALALGYVVDSIRSSGRVLLLILFLINYFFSLAHVVWTDLHGSLRGARAIAARELQTIVPPQPGSDLPIVISSGLRYLPMAYYTPADSNGKLYEVADAQEALLFTESGSDSLDLDLLVLRRYFPLQVEDYAGFMSKHREFLLVANGHPEEWLPACLAHDGYTLRIVSVEGGTTVYRVTVTP